MQNTFTDEEFKDIKDHVLEYCEKIDYEGTYYFYEDRVSGFVLGYELGSMKKFTSEQLEELYELARSADRRGLLT